MSENFDWQLPENVTSGYVDQASKQIASINGLSVINIFVGANSVGKSRLLRSLYLLGVTGLSRRPAELEDLRVVLADSRNAMAAFFRRFPNLTAVGGIEPNILEPLLVPDALRADVDVLKPIRDVAQRLLKTRGDSISYSSSGPRLPDGSLASETLRNLGKQLLGPLAALPTKYVELSILSSTYIPVLRGLRPLGLGNHPLFDRTIRDYFNNESERRRGTVYTGETLFAEIRSMLLGSHAERRRIRMFESFLSRALFQSEEVELIPREANDVVWVRIGNREEREIFNLGDGIQHALILTFPMFSRPNTMFFIEEPELHLHPGMQRKILDAFMESRRAPEFEKNLLFMTTHSNHFMDMSLDLANVAIYRFGETVAEATRLPASLHRIARVSSADHATLEALGVRKSSVLLVNATIWVEGISERWFFRRLLELYQKANPKRRAIAEDIHFGFVEYGGANIVHYAFIEGSENKPIEAKFLCGNAIVIADSDNGKKSARLENLERTHGAEGTVVLKDVREVENLLSPELIRAVIAVYEGVKFEETPDFAFEDYRSEYLGTFIDLRLGATKKRRGMYADDKTGTIRDKVGFWKHVLTYLDSSRWEGLPDVTRMLAERIYEFVLRHNPS